MKKIIIATVALAMCFALPVSAANILTLSLDSINTAVGENETVIYTPSYGSTILGNGSESENGFINHYVVTVIPRITGSDVSEDLEGNISSELSSETVPEISAETSDVTDGAASSEETFPIVSEGGSVAETAAVRRESEYKFKVEAVYAPGTDVKNVAIPDDGFVVVFPAVTGDGSSAADESALGRNVTAADIEAGAPVAVYGVDFETNTLSDGAYVQIDLSGKDLMGDIPQTSDNGAVMIFTALGIVAVAGAAFVYRRKMSY